MFIRTANAGDAASFGASTDPDLPDLTEQTSRMWADGRSRPQWCFIASDRDGRGDRDGELTSEPDRVLARMGLFVVHDPSAAIDSRHPDVDLLRRAFNALPLELGVFGLGYPGGTGPAIELLREVLGRLDVAPGTIIEPRSNAETHPTPRPATRSSRRADSASSRKSRATPGRPATAPHRNRTTCG